uniref:Uncharacterized protein n=1 Tax=Cacopsylla melanoneura TaxID=428564 RepID=A0A8D8W2N3_9HEMI
MNIKFITIIERLRIGHALCPVYLNKIGIKDSPNCECGLYGDLNHVILGCKLRIGRDSFFNELLPHISTLPVNVEFLVFSELSIIKRKLYYYIQKQNIDL